MKFVTIAVLFAVVAMAAADRPQYDLEQAPQLFEQFKKDYNKTYKDEEDEQRHYEAFKQSLEDINKLNAESTSATYGINSLADMLPEEYQNMQGTRVD